MKHPHNSAREVDHAHTDDGNVPSAAGPVCRGCAVAKVGCDVSLPETLYVMTAPATCAVVVFRAFATTRSCRYTAGALLALFFRVL